MLTEKQQQVLDFIRDYQLEHGASPTLKEMRIFMKVSSDNSILKHLNALVTKGFIKKGDTPRSIALLDEIKEKLNAVAKTFLAPVLGYIPAGGPVISEESVVDHMNIDVSLVKDPSQTFILRVKGDSMIEAGIFEDDTVIVDASIEPKLGDIVVALVDGGNTVKRFMRERDGSIYLQPENPKYQNIYPESELQIQGVVTGLMRRYL
ncbi:MAG: LexA repressor, repressor LexA [Candidatus Peregrinibacteria bacterium GW2011_GWF2_33_10]|nr:MAG: LexA repressor, repressor LexA [Candidatus Peregrinibacteria bacterium GW2011_GWF2_33_10]OGJ44518.1 MAG: repressor LexA [Candidatus Peregrinibacteria bacterium RIFOXYA2_FULL_33_21]OGJ46754.1 MAG: repressor LexA [Candidatus Peregrinibacteria bacterium RIFOXYA12_FULL_33_12]OGJ50326.1 MAG: repressor LexA [Candidatus Peregrinibacteria bacterium RIFOXYB2_FULL_33_20]